MDIKLPLQPYVPYKDWTPEYDNPMPSFDPSKLSLHLEPEQNESYLVGEVLAKRMKDKGLNSNALKYLLDNPKLIPEEWKGKYVYFFGTILRDPNGYRYVLYLCWSDGRWQWHAFWLERDWDADRPSAVVSELGHSALCPSCGKEIVLSAKLEI